MAGTLSPLQVVWIHDDLIRPPGPKMVVCVCPDAGLFARINTAGWRAGSVPILRQGHPFLTHDSHIECGRVFELDDYVVEDSIQRGCGVIGQVADHLVPALIQAVRASRTLGDTDKAAIEAALAGLAGA